MFDKALFDQIVFDGEEVLPLPPPPGVCVFANPLAYDGYRCFIEQYVKCKIRGLGPCKLPDGTSW